MIKKDEMENINQLSDNSSLLLFSNLSSASEDISEEQAQFDLIYTGSQKQPVYIGTMNFIGKRDKKYEEKKQKGVIDEDFIQEIIKLDEKPEFSILYPDVYLTAHLKRGEKEKCKWTPRINQKFMEGAILSGRPIVLVTHPSFFLDSKTKGWMAGPLTKNATLYELLALKMNNYLFKKLDDNKTIAWREHAIEKVDLSNLFNTYETVSTNKISYQEAYNTFKESIISLEKEFDSLFSLNKYGNIQFKRATTKPNI